MSKITLIIQKKKYQGESESGKSHNFLTSGNGGTFFSIPKKAVTEWNEVERDWGTTKLPMIEVTFDDWATQLGDLGRTLDDVLTRLITVPNQVIRE